MNVEELIEEVRKFPVLYDQSNDKYRNAEYREKVWQRIAKNLESEGGVEECKRKWSSIRDQLRRTLQKRKGKSGQAAFQKPKYKYEDILTFLVPYLGEREGTSNVPKPQYDQEDDEQVSNDHQEDFPQETNKRRLADPEPTSEYENIPCTSRDTTLLPTTSFPRPKTMKRKITRFQETPKDSPSAQLMAYLIAEKEAEKKDSRQQSVDPVDAFLGGIAPSLKVLSPLLLNEAKGKIFAIVQDMEMRQLQINASNQGNFSNFGVFSPSSSGSAS